MPYWSAAPRCTQGEPEVPRVTEFVGCDYAIFRAFGDPGPGRVRTSEDDVYLLFQPVEKRLPARQAVEGSQLA